MNIVHHGDQDIAVTKIIRQINLPVIIYGRGSIASYTAKKMRLRGIIPSDYVVDDEYAANLNGSCLSVSECNAKYREFILVLGFSEAFFMDATLLKAKFPGAVKVLYYSETYDCETITRDYYLEHQSGYKYLKQYLVDETSKLSYQAYLNAKLNSDASFLWPYVIIPQYFPATRMMTQMPEPDFLRFRDGEVFVNCGAYDGDTIRSFLRVVGDKCTRIYCLEPDKRNAEVLLQYVRSAGLIKTVKVLAVGAFKRKDTLHFKASHNMRSCIEDDGETLIDVDTIDNIVGSDPVTFINMDIEGSELDALRGARSTILNHKPTLAISAYHKRDDCITIPRYIRSLVPEYKFYFRLHRTVAIDACLYATCR